jgi:Zn-dependent M28 family amino/carboxypeptidase
MRSLIGLSKKNTGKVVKGLRSYIINNNQLPALIGFSAAELAQNQWNVDGLIVKNVTMHSPITFSEVPTWNIVGVLKGTDSNAKPVVVTAHYDHVGRQPGGVCLGADDNASGVSAIIQVAAAYAALKKKPVRDIIFVAFGAEELGLIGSEYFMSNFNKEDIFANINVDMIGRRDTISKDNYVYILGTRDKPIIHNLHREANLQTVNLQLDYAYGNEVGSSSMMNRSDHYHFYKKEIPVIAFFSGLHGDYHTPRDTIEKIDFPLMTKRVQLIFATLYLLVNADSLDN